MEYFFIVSLTSKILIYTVIYTDFKILIIYINDSVNTFSIRSHYLVKVSHYKVSQI